VCRTEEIEQRAAAAFLGDLGVDITPDDLWDLALAGCGPEHRRSGDTLIYSEDALLKWASTIERVVPNGQATVDDLNLE
jgi:hypothetical protein